MKTPKGWQRCPSVTRKGRFFYRHAEKRLSVVCLWLSDNWVIQIDGRGTQSGEYTTAQTAMNAAERMAL